MPRLRDEGALASPVVGPLPEPASVVLGGAGDVPVPVGGDVVAGGVAVEPEPVVPLAAPASSTRAGWTNWMATRRSRGTRRTERAPRREGRGSREGRPAERVSWEGSSQQACPGEKDSLRVWRAEHSLGQARSSDSQCGHPGRTAGSGAQAVGFDASRIGRTARRTTAARGYELGAFSAIARVSRWARALLRRTRPATAPTLSRCAALLPPP